MKDLSARGEYADTFEGMLKREPEQETQVWVGSRRKFVRLDAQGLWLPLGSEQGFWAADVEHAQRVAARRGWAPCRVHQLLELLGHWPWEMAKDVPIRAVDSPLGGIFLLPDPDESRPAKALAEACAPDEFRWLPVRPTIKPSQQYLPHPRQHRLRPPARDQGARPMTKTANDAGADGTLSYEHFRKVCPATRIFQLYSSDVRANHAASHRLKPGKKASFGEFFYTHEMVPNIAFPTAKAATTRAYEEYLASKARNRTDDP